MQHQHSSVGRGLTPRSSGAPTAGHAGHQALGLRPILRLLSSAPCRRRPLSSNVRQHNSAMAYLGLRSISNANPNASVRCPQTSQDAQEHRHFSTGGLQTQVAPRRFAVGSCYAPPRALECQFVDPPPYQHRAASSPWAAAVGNGAVPPYANVLLVSGQ